MTKPLNIAKFRKDITKNIPGISLGFRDPKTFIDTGSYLLNYFITGDFFKGMPLEGKFTLFAGESGAGKSYIASANAIKNAQEQGIFVVAFDTENALDESWLQALGVDTSPDKLEKIKVGRVDDLAKSIIDFIDWYKKETDGLDYDDKPKVLLVVDSFGMMITDQEYNQAQAGEMKGDKGIMAKKLGGVCRLFLSTAGNIPMGMIGTQHTYASQDMFNPDATIKGGEGPIFAASIVVALQQLKLKEDDEGKKTSEVNGIRARVCVRKTRYTKSFQNGQLKIPYNTGMDKYSGIFELFKNKGIVQKNGPRWVYVSPVDKVEFNDFEKNYTNEMLDKMMKEYMEHFKILDSLETNPLVEDDTVDVEE